MKALSLGWSRLQGFSQCCRESGIELKEHVFDEEKLRKNIKGFAETYLDDIRQADMLVAADFGWLTYFGQSFGINQAIIDAVSVGATFVFEIPRAWDDLYGNNSQQANSEYVKNLLKLIGVTPTRYRVFTDDSPSDVGGGAIGWYRAGDNCFLNADVLGDNDSISLGFTNILAFEKGVFPVVELGPLHYLVNDGDHLGALDFGLRPAVFVEVKRSQMSGYVIGGRFIADAYDAMGGFVPGIELNKQAIMALLKKVQSARRKKSGFEVDVYQYLYDFERGLGDILIARLPRHEAALLKEASLNDLIRTTLDNWIKVEDLFAPINRANFSKSTSAIPHGVRLFLCHPVKLNFSSTGINEEAVQQLRIASSVVRTAIDRLHNQARTAQADADLGRM